MEPLVNPVYKTAFGNAIYSHASKLWCLNGSHETFGINIEYEGATVPNEIVVDEFNLLDVIGELQKSGFDAIKNDRSTKEFYEFYISFRPSWLCLNNYIKREVTITYDTGYDPNFSVDVIFFKEKPIKIIYDSLKSYEGKYCEVEVH